MLKAKAVQLTARPSAISSVQKAHKSLMTFSCGEAGESGELSCKRNLRGNLLPQRGGQFPFILMATKLMPALFRQRRAAMGLYFA